VGAMIESGARARKVETPLDVDMESQPDYMRDIKAGHYTRRKESPPVCVPVVYAEGCAAGRATSGGTRAWAARTRSAAPATH
jgi:hypothetical protein